jgi:hippurate hydrolase
MNLKMDSEEFLREAKGLKADLVRCRRALHQNPETGFALDKTVAFVKSELEKIGLAPMPCGKAGLVVTIGKRGGKVIMLRADMDALPICEQAEVPFASQNGAMHACGHDMHTAMLLGAAVLLKAHEEELCGTVKLMFQPAEEIFEGSRDMIEAGVLQNPQVDGALMMHVMAGMPLPSGTVLVSAAGVSAPAADTFTIEVKGKGCHGSMPNTGVDPLLATAHMVIALQEVQTRELAIDERAVLTFGTFSAGNTPNVIPDVALLKGSLRTYDEEVRAHIKERMEEVVQGIAKTFRTQASLTFQSGCPSLYNDETMVACAEKYASELLGKGALSVADLQKKGGSSAKSAGSEDFAYISRAVPSVMLALAAGNPQQGYAFPQHHPKVTFDEEALPFGSAMYAYFAMRWLQEQGK